MFVIHIFTSFNSTSIPTSPQTLRSFLFITFGMKKKIQINSSRSLYIQLSLENCLWRKSFDFVFMPSPSLLSDFPQSHLLFHNLEQFHRIKYPEKNKQSWKHFSKPSARNKIIKTQEKELKSEREECFL